MDWYPSPLLPSGNFDVGITLTELIDHATVTEGWLELDKHYSLELCFYIERQPEVCM